MDTKTLELLNFRLSLAQTFGKNYKKEVENALKEYKIESFSDLYYPDLYNRLQVPYIFSTIESGLPSMFETIPTITMTQAGKKDGEFTDWANSVWSYLRRYCNLKEVIEDVGFTFLLAGFASARYGWETETEVVEEEQEQPLLDEFGQPMMDEMGQPMTQPIVRKREVIVKDEPFVKYCKYDRVYFSPESEFVVDDRDNRRIPYIVFEETLTPDEVKYIYDVEIEPDSTVDLDKLEGKVSGGQPDNSEVNKEDLGRCHVYHYYGLLPEKQVKDGWKPNKVYYSCFSKDKILKKPVEYLKKPFLLLGNYGSPETFFKFGEAKVIRDLEADVSLGRSVMADYRDRLSTKVAVPNGTEFDEEAFKDPKKFTYVRFIGNNYPQYVTPPQVPEVVPQSIEMSKLDIQLASGQLDISRGGTESTVDTASGQKIFAAVHEKRINRKRNKIGDFIIALAKNLLVMCADKWDAQKFGQITDMEPAEIEQNQFIEKLKMVGEEYDVTIEMEDVVQNKEARAAQAIAMYRELKENPLINQVELVKKAIKVGFDVVDVDRFLSGELSPDILMQAVDQLATQGLIPPQLAQGIFQQFAQMQQGGDVGRPMTQNPVDVVDKSMPGADATQIAAQNQASYKQTNVAKGPQGV